MKTTNKLFYLALPLVLLGCQTLAPGRMPTSTGVHESRSATVALAGTPGQAAEVPPTTDVTLTTPEARGAVISTQPVAEGAQPASYGGLALSVKWPAAAAPRRAQLIPATANSLWVKVYTGDVGAATGSAAPGATPIASRVVGRGMSDPIPGASPTPCCPQQTEERSTVFLSLPAGTVSVWVGTFAEGPTEVSTASVFLSSAQKPFGITANKLTSGASLNLAGNPAIAPNISGVSPAFMGQNGTVTIQGTNFGTSAQDIKVHLYQAPGCSNCQPNLTAMTVNSVSGTAITATVPAGANGTYQIQVEAGGFKVVGGSVGILDKNQGLRYTLESVKQYNPANEPQQWATAQGARVVVKKLTGYVQCCSDPISLPLSNVVVTLPGGATTSLDASASFTTADLGVYALSSSFGDAKGNDWVSSFKVVATFNTSRDYTSAQATHKDLGLDLSLVKPDCETCQPSQSYTGIAPSLFYGFKSAYLADAANKKIMDLQSTDFSVSGSPSLAFDTGSQLVSPAAGAQAGAATVSATLDIHPSVRFDVPVNILAPNSVVLKYEWNSSPPANYYNLNSYEFKGRLVYYEPVEDRTYEVGQDSDFRWTVMPTTEGASASVDANGYFTTIATGNVTIQAELKKRSTMKATMSITIQ